MKNSFLKKISLIGVLLCIYNPVKAQQDAQYTQYMYNMNILNPAYAGLNEGTINISLLGRTQWINVPGAPQTATLSIHSPITSRMGLGLSVLADKIGPINEQFIFADYSYTIPVGYYDNLSFGVKAGVSIFNGLLTELQTVISEDINFNENILNAKPNFGFGLFYYSDTYYVGFSVPNLLKTRYLEKKGGIITDVSRKAHVFLTGGYVFDINYNWKFKPSFMTKTAFGAPFSMDLSANFLYNETLEVGTSYRFGDSISVIMGAKVTENLRVGYSYDFAISDIRRFTSGSHELILLFDIMTSYEIISPRFF